MKILAYSGFVHLDLKKNPGLFQDFQEPFSQFSRTKNHKLLANFHRNDAFIPLLRYVALAKINLIKFVGKSGSLY